MTRYTITVEGDKPQQRDLCELHDRALKKLLEPASGGRVERVGGRQYVVKEDDEEEPPPPPRRRGRPS